MLYFSNQVEYGLNLLIVLAKAKKRLSLREVAKQSKMPYRFLNKVVKPLIEVGLIDAREGKNGGYALSKAPGRIKLKQIYDSLGEGLSITQCHSSKHCPLGFESKCKVRPVWIRIKKNIDAELNKITLKDLI